MYYVEYRTKNKQTIGNRQSLNTTSICKARGKIVNQIGMDGSISGGIFTSMTAKKPVGFIYFADRGPMFAHIWSDGTNTYLTDSSGKITPIVRK